MSLTLAEREAMLRGYVAAAEAAPVVWGESDCSSWAATWVRLVTSRPVTLPAYASREEAHALIAAAGGLDRLWADALAPIGLVPTAAPELGDVAIVDTRAFGPVGLIVAHGGIGYWRAETGARAFSPRRLVAAWRVA